MAHLQKLVASHLFRLQDAKILKLLRVVITKKIGKLTNNDIKKKKVLK